MAKRKGKRKSMVVAGFDYFQTVPTKYAKPIAKVWQTQIPGAKFKIRKHKSRKGKSILLIR